jgi:O-antigen/teichoic acid export membrane protein
LSTGRNLAATFTGRGLSVGATLLWIAVTARLYSVDELAFLAWLAIAASLIETVKGFGLGSLLVRRLPVLDRDPVTAGKLKRTYFLITGSLLFLVMAIGLTSTPAPWRWGLAGICLQSFTGAWALTLQASSRFVEASLSLSLFGIASRALPATAAWCLDLTLIQMLQATALLSVLCVAGLVLMFPIGLVGRDRGGLAPSEWWPDAKHYFLSAWLRYGATQIDQVMAAVLFPAELLASYFVLRRLYSIGVLAIDAGVDVLAPQLARTAGSEPGRARDQLVTVISYGLPAGLGVAMLIAWNCIPITRWIFGAKFEPHAGLIVWLAAASVTYALYSLLLCGQLAFGQARSFTRLVGLAALINNSAAALLSLVIGIYALPAAMCLGYGTASWAASTQDSVTGAALRKLAVPAGLAAVFGVVVSVNRSLGDTSGIPSLALAAILLTALWLAARRAWPMMRGTR